jgi:exonuclease VII large subunit
MGGERVRCHRRRLDTAVAQQSELVGVATKNSLAALRRQEKQLTERQGESESAATGALSRAQRRLDDASALLRARDPVARGFAVVRKSGRVIKGAADIGPEDALAIELRDGLVDATVTSVQVT